MNRKVIDKYWEQYEIRNKNLNNKSMQGIDRENEHVYDAGFINGMRFIMYELSNKDPIFRFLTNEEIELIIEARV
jgi:hypothetical protein